MLKYHNYNQKSGTAQNINNEINNLFAMKLLDIIHTSTTYTIYNVEYKAFVNGNILSLVIKCTLKEGKNPQRIIMQTYNYDLENNKLLTLEELINIKQLDKNEIQNKIIEKIKEKNITSEGEEELGYNIFVRDINSEEYLIENVKTCFLGEDGHLYIIFAYGNKNFTQEMDYLVF